MSNQGKRMVKENLIAQIGQGGGTEYTAGTGIDITEDVISVDTTTIQPKLSAGDGINISEADTITVDTTTIQEKLTAGDNITIAEGVISATDTTYTAGTGIDITANAISVSSGVLSGVLPTYGNTELVPTTEAEFNAWLDRLPILNTSDAPEENIGDGKGDYFFIQGAFLIKPQGATDDKSTWYIGTTNNSSNITSNNATFNHILVYRNADRGHCFLGCRYNQNNTTAYNSTSIKRLSATFKGDLVIETASTQAAYDYVHSYAQKVIIPHAKAGAQPLADVPTTDGTYTLQATVSDGTVTITWVSQA